MLIHDGAWRAGEAFVVRFEQGTNYRDGDSVTAEVENAFGEGDRDTDVVYVDRSPGNGIFTVTMPRHDLAPGVLLRGGFSDCVITRLNRGFLCISEITHTFLSLYHQLTTIGFFRNRNVVML